MLLSRDTSDVLREVLMSDELLPLPGPALAVFTSFHPEQP